MCVPVGYLYVLKKWEREGDIRRARKGRGESYNMYTRYWQYNFRLLNDLPRRAAHVPLRLDAHGRADSTRTAVRELRLAIAIIN